MIVNDCVYFEHYLPHGDWSAARSLVDNIEGLPISPEMELGRQYSNDRQEFYEMALNSTLRNGRPRY